MKMIEKKDWDEFRDTGLLLYINQILHAFGWAIVVDGGEDGKTGKFKVADAYPAKCKFRGFNEDSVDKAYKKISDYMSKNAKKLHKEAYVKK